MNNRELQEFYNRVYKKGERKHYSKFLLTKEGLTQEKRAILNTTSWNRKRVLDIGCGTGELAYHIAQKAKYVCGIDYAPSAIKIAQKHYQRDNLTYLQSDVESLDEAFDVIVMAGVLEHIDEPFLLLKKLSHLLAPKGSIIVTCPNWSNMRGYILLALAMLFDARITLADIHYFTPVEFEAWARKLRMKLSWNSIEQEWGHGEKMIADFKKRLPKVLQDTQVKISPQKISRFIAWLSKHYALETNQKASGAVGIYHLKR